MLSPEEFRKKYPKKYYSDYESFLNIYGLITDENTAIEKINKHWNSNIYRTLNQQYKDDYINANIETFRNFKNQFIEDAKVYDKFDAIDDLIKHTNDIDYARQLIKDATSTKEYDEVIDFFNNNTGLFRNDWKTSKDKSNKNYRSEPPPKDNEANNRNTSKKTFLICSVESWTSTAMTSTRGVIISLTKVSLKSRTLWSISTSSCCNTPSSSIVSMITFNSSSVTDGSSSFLRYNLATKSFKTIKILIKGFIIIII